MSRRERYRCELRQHTNKHCQGQLSSLTCGIMRLMPREFDQQNHHLRASSSKLLLHGFPVFGKSGNPRSGNSDTRISGNPDFRISGNPDIRTSGYPEIRISEYPDIRISGNPDIRISGYPDIGISGYRDIRICRLLNMSSTLCYSPNPAKIDG